MAENKKIIWIYCVYEYRLMWVISAYISTKNGTVKVRPIDEPSHHAGLADFNKFSNIPSTPKTMFRSEITESDCQYIWLNERDDDWVKTQLAIALNDAIKAISKDVRELMHELRVLDAKCLLIGSSLMSISNFDSYGKGTEDQEHTFIF